MSNFIKAKSNKSGPKTANILGVDVSGTDMGRLLRKISIKIDNNADNKPLFVITAYSENILETLHDRELKTTFDMADEIVSDGVSVAAASDYLRLRTGNGLRDLGIGLATGRGILLGRYKDRVVVGVKLAEKILEMSVKKKWEVFLLGGINGEAGELAEKYGKYIKYYEPPMGMEINDEKETRKILSKINQARPDILLVGLGRFRQEKWIAANLRRLKTKVVIGVGSSFDELAGRGKWAVSTPEWVERMGLKWLWRVTRDPAHLRRAWNAFPVFAWKVYTSNSD